jgi:hypothetical protein
MPADIRYILHGYICPSSIPETDYRTLMIADQTIVAPLQVTAVQEGKPAIHEACSVRLHVSVLLYQEDRLLGLQMVRCDGSKRLQIDCNAKPKGPYLLVNSLTSYPEATSFEPYIFGSGRPAKTSHQYPESARKPRCRLMGVSKSRKCSTLIINRPEPPRFRFRHSRIAVYVCATLG